MEKHGYGIQGLPVSTTTVPSRPEMIEGSSTEALAWRGAVGAQYYELERQEVVGGEEGRGGVFENKGAAVGATHAITAGLRKGGKWVKVSEKLLDSTNPYVPFKDSTAQPGKTYRYRIYAVNAAGRGAASLPLVITAPLPLPPTPPPPPPTLSSPRDQIPASLRPATPTALSATTTPPVVSSLRLNPEQAPVSTTTAVAAAAAEAVTAATNLTPPASVRPPPIPKEAQVQQQALEMAAAGARQGA